MKAVGNWAFYGCQNLTDLKVSYHTKDIKEDAFCGCENLFNVHIIEFDNDNVSMDEVKKGRRHVIRILKQVNRKRAESYAREYGISMLFI